MKTTEEQIILITGNKVSNEINNGYRDHNPGLRALLSIKNLTNTLEKDSIEILRMESELNELNRNGLFIIENNTETEAFSQWKLYLQEVNNAILGINNTLSKAKNRIDQQAKEGYTELWIQLAIHITALKDHFTHTADLGLALLSDALHPRWENEFVLRGTTQIRSLVTQVESYRSLLQLIERYTPEELHSINQLIITQVPADFTYEETVEYKNDYYQALVNFKAEFKEEKNLWDTFLDILAGGTHQTPAERVMMERWVEGDKEVIK